MPVLMPDATEPAPPIDLSAVKVTWGDLTLAIVEPWLLQDVDGWRSLPPQRVPRTPRPNAHGEFDAPAWSSGRLVTATGDIVDLAALSILEAATVPSLSLADLSVDVGFGALSARARVFARDIPTGLDYMHGHTTWSIAWLCPDPLRYGATVSVTAGLPQESGGLVFPLFEAGFLDFGPVGQSGRVTVTNPGTAAEARPVFTVTGTLPAGFELVETTTGRRLRYEGPVTAAGDAVTLDSATGRVRLGTADRGGSLTRAEWWGVPAGGTREVLFTSLGGYSADASLTVTTRPTFW